MVPCFFYVRKSRCLPLLNLLLISVTPTRKPTCQAVGFRHIRAPLFQAGRQRWVSQRRKNLNPHTPFFPLLRQNPDWHIPCPGQRDTLAKVSAQKEREPNRELAVIARKSSRLNRLLAIGAPPRYALSNCDRMAVC
jgi:hypothetical protein